MSQQDRMMVGVLGSGHLACTTETALSVLGFNVGPPPPANKFPTEWNNCELWFVAVDVVDHDKLDGVHEAMEALQKFVDYNNAAPQITVVLLSQVPPGYTRKWADKFKNLYYQVDTIIVKDALRRMTKPEQVIIGSRDSFDGLPMCYQRYLLSLDCPIRQMSYESAELAKCAINYALAEQITTAHKLKKAADVLGADYDAVRTALHGDARIGPRAYLRPGKLNQHLTRDVETIDRLIGLG